MHPSSLRHRERSEGSEGSIDVEYPNNGGMYVPNKDGVTTWFTGDIYSTKLTGPRQRTQSGEYDALLTAAGLRRHRVIATDSPLCVIEAVAA